MTDTATPKTETAKPKSSWTDNLDREDYRILEKVITAGRLCRDHGIRQAEAMDLLVRGEQNVDPLRRPDTLEEGHVILKSGLRLAYETNPVGLVEACATSGGLNIISSMAADFASKVDRNELVILVATCLSNRYALTAPLRPLAASSNAIEYWNPAEGGLPSFIRTYINTAVKEQIIRYLYLDDMKMKKAGVSMVAMESLAAAGTDIGIDENGDRFIARKEKVQANEPDEERLSHLTVSYVSKKPFDPADMNREDKVYLLDLMRRSDMDTVGLSGAATHELMWMEMLSAAAQIVDNAERMPERHIAEDEARDWDPSLEPLWVASPKFYQHFGRGGRVRLSNDTDIKSAPVGLSKVAAIIQMEMQFDVAHDATPSENAAAARNAVEEEAMWRKSIPRAGTRHGDRVDFRYLSRKLGHEAGAPEDTKSFEKKMREMGLRYLSATFGRPGFERVASGLQDAMRSWSPAKEYFSSPVMGKIQEMVVAGIITNEVAERMPDIISSPKNKQERRDIKAMERFHKATGGNAADPNTLALPLEEVLNIVRSAPPLPQRRPAPRLADLQGIETLAGGDPNRISPARLVELRIAAEQGGGSHYMASALLKLTKDSSPGTLETASTNPSLMLEARIVADKTYTAARAIRRAAKKLTQRESGRPLSVVGPGDDNLPTT